MQNSTKKIKLDAATFLRIQKWYILAILAIAMTITIAQILIQQHLNSQLNDSRVINVAGRQRALSQKLVKEALLLRIQDWDKIRQLRVLEDLKSTLRLWKVSHEGLVKGNDSMGLPVEKNPEILTLFNELDIRHKLMVNATEQILNGVQDSSLISKNIDLLLLNEPVFLSKMDAIVNKYDTLSKRQLEQLKLKEILLFSFSLLILLLEIVFIFRPLSLQIRQTISNLIQSQKDSENSARAAKQLFLEKEKSLQQLQELNFVIDNAALFASTRNDGTVVFMSRKFLNLLEKTSTNLNIPLSEILTEDEGQQQYLREILTSKRKNIRTEEIKVKTRSGIDLWLDMSIIPMHQSGLEQSILILCSDITQRKRNQLKIEELTKQNYEESIRQKQLQASQIVEGQEEERKRIAKDIHDGIGQMLTALKFNIESVNLDNKEKSEEKLAFLKSLTSDLIKGVRTATFNLTPPELKDHGVFPALQKMTQELSKLTGKNILFENKSEESIRFNSLAETNIYRVTQEAVNNAVKYAQANYILVTVNYKDDILSVVIDDDGIGFDSSILSRGPKNDSDGGMGFFFMKERISYINGRLFINSIPNNGTRVTINYNLKKAVLNGA
ncbi:ATP-binding protein [Ascidiimonas sp. W6]|uniref:PAS domain-containing sensor histidine kinase n=1 Tax=Ascidiimonas meishanensis TaxID=3128903 RepID=UPI0030EF3224